MQIPSAEAMKKAKELWDAIAGDDFSQSRIHSRNVAGTTFRVYHPTGSDIVSPRVYFDMGMPLLVCPRIKGLKHRFLLVAGHERESRWDLQRSDVESFISWSHAMDHVVTWSTWKSGGSHPWTFHGQSFPFETEDEEGQKLFLTALVEPSISSHLQTLVRFGEMGPHFPNIRIETLTGGYPAPALRISYDDADAITQVTKKVYELVFNYDHGKSMNIVVVPRQHVLANGEAHPVIYVFPRRRDGSGIFAFNGHRWQIASLEVAGMLQVRSPDHIRQLTTSAIQNLLNSVRPDQSDVDYLFSLVNSY